jgi:hypothetical protein
MPLWVDREHPSTLASTHNLACLRRVEELANHLGLPSDFVNPKAVKLEANEKTLCFLSAVELAVAY